MATVLNQRAIQARASGAEPFVRFAWAVLAWNVVVVLWGAVVRATGSGAGCGSHWPLCNGEALPRAPEIKTIIEFSHRLTSAVALIGVAALCVWAFRRFPRGDRVRRMAALSALFLIAEALLGAGLVLFAYVDRDRSLGRAIYLSAHLVNTQLLLAALTLTAWFARDVPFQLPRPRARPALALAALPLAILVSVTGAIAALGDTLFPAASLAAGIHEDFSAAAHFLLRLRIVHPALAIASGLFFIFAAGSVLRAEAPPLAKTAAGAAAGLSLAQLCAGAMNLVLLAPVWMQLVHLLIADLLWIALVILAAEAGGGYPAARSASSGARRGSIDTTVRLRGSR